jgi:hypothetical protein
MPDSIRRIRAIDLRSVVSINVLSQPLCPCQKETPLFRPP